MYAFNSGAIFSPGHPYIESTTVLSDTTVADLQQHNHLSNHLATVISLYITRRVLQYTNWCSKASVSYLMPAGLELVPLPELELAGC